MGKRSRIALFLLVFVYVLGLLVGGLYQVSLPAQKEMLEYLENGISDYSGGILSGIKGAFFDNLPELFVMMLTAFLPFGVFVVGGVIAVRGFLAGFAVTSVLRFFGAGGAVLCLGNLLSAGLTVSAYALFGIFILNNGRYAKGVKWGFFSFIFLALVILADSLIKGAISPLAVRLWR